MSVRQMSTLQQFIGATIVLYFIVHRFEPPSLPDKRPSSKSSAVDETPKGDIPWDTPHTAPIDILHALV